MSADLKYWAFISYSHEDARWCDWLHRAIETYRIPGRLVGRISRDGSIPSRIFPVFRDRDELPSSADLNQTIAESLRQSRYLIVICSPRSALSRWVNEEVRLFKSLGRGDRILCLIAGGEPNAHPGSALPECFPAALREPVGTHDQLPGTWTEPLAADVRQGKDDKDDAKLKIISGLLGLGFDELKQREEQRRRQGRALGMLIAAVFTGALLLPDPGPVPAVRLAGFDAYQKWFPRQRRSEPAVIVAIDDESIDRVGQWPWSRDVLARIIARIGTCDPAAIAISIVFSEPDRLSPETIASTLLKRDPVVAASLARKRPNDEILAATISSLPVVLAVAPSAAGKAAGKFPPVQSMGRPVDPVSYPAAWRSLPIIDEAARGHGFIGRADSGESAYRRVPLVSFLGDHAILFLGLESIRVALDAPAMLQYRDQDAPGVVIGDLRVPTQADGTAWLHFSAASGAMRVISAASVLEDRFDRSMLEKKIVLLGVIATGLGSATMSARGEQLPDVDIHREIVENIFDGALLSRPAWGRPVEALAFLLAAGLIVLVAPRVSARRSTLIPVGCCAALLSGGIGAFVSGRLLLDAATPMLGICTLFAATMTYGYVANSMRQSVEG